MEHVAFTLLHAAFGATAVLLLQRFRLRARQRRWRRLSERFNY
jgi:hypothetical protein